jgi:hypothetical protein
MPALQCEVLSSNPSPTKKKKRRIVILEGKILTCKMEKRFREVLCADFYIVKIQFLKITVGCRTSIFLNRGVGLSVVVCTCNPSYLGGRYLEDRVLRPAWAKY